MKQWILATRLRFWTAAALIALAVPAAAFAAWTIYTGAQGSTNGTIVTAGSAGTAITMTTQGTGYDVPVDPTSGSPQGVKWNLTNNDPNHAHTVSGATASFTSTPTDCAAHLHVMTGDLSLFDVTVPAGGTVATTAGVRVSADSTLPDDCSSGSWTLTVTGTTS